MCFGFLDSTGILPDVPLDECVKFGSVNFFLDAAYAHVCRCSSCITKTEPWCFSEEECLAHKSCDNPVGMLS